MAEIPKTKSIQATFKELEENDPSKVKQSKLRKGKKFGEYCTFCGTNLKNLGLVVRDNKLYQKLQCRNAHCENYNHIIEKWIEKI